MDKMPLVILKMQLFDAIEALVVLNSNSLVDTDLTDTIESLQIQLNQTIKDLA